MQYSAAVLLLQLSFCPKMTLEDTSEHDFLEEFALVLHHAPDNHVSPLLKILATSLHLLKFIEGSNLTHAYSTKTGNFESLIRPIPN